jgi:FkbM family methyltransferase
MSTPLGRRTGRAAQAWHKLRWGAGIVGPWAATAGVVRLAALRVSRSGYARVLLRSGVSIGFEVPAQVPPALVVFRTLIDPEFALLTDLAETSLPTGRDVASGGPVVLDVGAAIGQFSLFAAQRPGTVVHAFEPSGRNVASLRRNIAENDLSDRIRVHQLALSDWEGEQRFTTQGNAYLSRPDAGAGGDRASLGTETVPVRTLASVCAELGLDRIAVLKINVAGYEPEVLAGAAPLLARGDVDVLIVLIGERSLRWFERCAEWGYRFYFYEPASRSLHELTDLSLSTLESPPSPARHVIAIHRTVLDRPGAVSTLINTRRRDVVSP